jgi:hypothetical protein
VKIFALQRINQTVRSKTKNWNAHTVVCHGNLATRAEEVKTEIAVISLDLRFLHYTLPAPPTIIHTFLFLSVIVHWIISFMGFNDPVYDNFNLQNNRNHLLRTEFQSICGSSMIKTLSFLYTAQVLLKGLITSPQIRNQ